LTSARVFFIGGLMSYRALFGWLSPWVFIPSLVVAPIFQILLFVYIGRSASLESDEFYVIGNGLQYASIPCVFAMTNIIAGERFQQTLGSILITPAPRLPLYIGRALPVVLNGFFVAAFGLAVGGWIVGIEIPSGSILPIALVTAVSALSCTGLGLASAAIGLVVRETAVLSNIIFGVLLVCTGANVPLDALPGWLSALAKAMPFTHGIEAARRLADGAGFGTVDGLVLREALVGALYATAGYLLIRVLENRSRKYATLERA
jgi:ABC-2 type transport system permease protein